MLTEAVNEMLTVDLEAGKAMLRDYVNATITFQKLAKKLGKSSKSIHRMLGPRGNPRAENIPEINKILQAHERITLIFKTKWAAEPLKNAGSIPLPFYQETIVIFSCRFLNEATIRFHIDF
jgi:DNA-binding phage protein